MNIYQPMVFVGLGGTGCLIGAELERRLRSELCGPDGRALTHRVPGGNYLPYQLPPCLQFVYADLNESELNRLRRQVVPSEEYRNAAVPTMHLANELTPTFDTYPEVARTLRLMASDYVRDWLPSSSGEPKVSPLVRGAGQLPTVGRAALFATFLGGVSAARKPIADAAGEISGSGPELAALGGRLGQTVDVFVAMSVAGGTGTGIFYDYFHLIGDVFQQRTHLRAQIYPLVLMPSAFDEGIGGGRRAKLNAGRALLDLFRLIDDQNGHSAGTEITSRGVAGTIGVRFPDRAAPIVLAPSTIQTGFLFSRADGVERDDLHRSVVSLVLSLVGTGQEHDDGGAVADRLYQSFADDFINRGVEREVPATTGIGRRGVSTSLVASMTIPVDDLADIVASRLLARSFDQLAMQVRNSGEENTDLVRRFASASNISPIMSRQPLVFTEPPPARGSTDIVRALRTRVTTMEGNLVALQAHVRRKVPELATAFDPVAGLDELLSDVDLFRARRVVEGNPVAEDVVGRSGVLGFLANRRSEPAAPNGITINPPAPRPLRDRRLGTDKAKWGDPEVRASIADQNDWYAWRARGIWNAAWDQQHNRWSQAMNRLRAQLSNLVDAFEEHAQAEPSAFAQRTAELQRPRVGVTYLLPPHNDLDAFYRAVFARLVVRHGERSAATEGELTHRVLGPDGWRHIWATAFTRGSEAGIAAARDRLKEEVKRLFLEDDGFDAEPLLPTMTSLLAAAARRDGTAVVSDADVRQFRSKLHGLVPANFSPQGSGSLKVLVSYPAGSKDTQIERYLRDEIRLPKESGTVVEFRPIVADSVAVVLFRTSMGITEVPELREILQFWTDALRDEYPQDFLKWRQRLGYDYGWIATTSEDRVRILHRLLNAMWNGNVSVLDGSIASPYSVRVSLGSSDGLGMTLDLTPFGEASSWGSLLRAYEDWTLADDDRVRRDFSEQLMRLQPDGVTGRPSEAHVVFRTFVENAGKQARLLQDMINKLAPGGQGWANQQYEFWSTTVTEALEMPFENVTTPIRENLRQLYEMVETRGGSPPDPLTKDVEPYRAPPTRRNGPEWSV